MPNLFVIGFDEADKAEELRSKLHDLEGKYVLDLREMVVAVKDEKGKVKLYQSGSLLSAMSPAFPGFCGSLTTLIFLNATTGAAGSALAAVGITNHFMKELAGTLVPGGSALFVLTGTPSPDRESILEELRGIGGKVLTTSVSQEDEAKLQAALEAARS
ncbi:MAG: DUF1269 domain-containing protein [Verrucomicrobia bacterium]|nr:DUF1269 domain-containing protein [Verrucomicrobiota bacterium]MBV8277277.1 DUF1269 domain-containing protein [Verrucomicrobiota bacterium]